MITLMGFAKRRAGLDQAGFSSYWRKRHGPLVAGVPDFIRHVRYYAQYHPIEDPDHAGAYLGDGDDHAGLGILQFDNVEARRAAYDERGYHEIIAPDEDNLRDPNASMLWFLAREKVMHDKGGPLPSEAITMIGAARRPYSMSQSEFSHHWGEVHGPLAVDTPDFIAHVHRYIQYHPLQEGDGGEQLSDEAKSFGGIGLMTFHSRAAMKAAYASSGFINVIQPDGRKMANPERSNLWFLAHEHVVHDSTRS